VKYIDEFRDGDLARTLASAIAREARPERSYNLMEFCGGHTHAISRYGLSDLLPANVKLIHGPGCPVCVLPVGRIDNAIALAARQIWPSALVIGVDDKDVLETAMRLHAIDVEDGIRVLTYDAADLLDWKKDSRFIVGQHH